VKGSDKRYPNVDLVRLEIWFFNHKPGKLLEYAHGCGVNLIHMLECGYDVEALDASIEAQKLVKQKLSQCPDIESKANFTHLDVNATQLSYPDGNFDYITCLSVCCLFLALEKRWKSC